MLKLLGYYGIQETGKIVWLGERRTHMSCELNQGEEEEAMEWGLGFLG